MELLAPAKNFTAAKAVLAAGADAVYFGGRKFGARAYADNMTEEEILSLIELSHLHGKKAYLTVNTLLKDAELERQLYAMIKRPYEAGLHGVIVQDFGVFCFLREHFPDLPLHCSTQMNVTTRFGAAFLKEQGAKRVVLARELSIKEIADIHRATDIELEVFVHGALCVCYSGQCLMSSMIGGRSGNRGACAQPCRMMYEVEGRKSFPLSPKDLCGIRHLPALLAAGVSSLKIEGRMKGLSYQTTVTAVYREYIDRLLSGGAKSYTVEDKDIKRLLCAGHRGGFTDAYYISRNAPTMMATEDSAHHRTEDKSIIEDMTPKRIPVTARVVACENEPLTITLTGQDKSVWVTTDLPLSPAHKQATEQDALADKLKKTGDYPFVMKETDIVTGGHPFVPMKVFNALRRTAMEELKEALLSDKKRRDARAYMPLQKTGQDMRDDTKPSLRIRVQTKEQLHATDEGMPEADVILPYALWACAKDLKKGEQGVIYALPVVLRASLVEAVMRFIKGHLDARYECSSYDGLGLLFACGVAPDHICGGMRLYAWSNRAARAFYRMGLFALYVPAELSEKELGHRANEADVMLLYGRMPLMYMANCIHKNLHGCDRTTGVTWLKDARGYRFPVFHICGECTNILYNSLPVMLFDEKECLLALGITRMELSFTTENEAEVKQVLRLYADGAVPKKGKDRGIYTKGHFHRGVKE